MVREWLGTCPAQRQRNEASIGLLLWHAALHGTAGIPNNMLDEHRQGRQQAAATLTPSHQPPAAAAGPHHVPELGHGAVHRQRVARVQPLLLPQDLVQPLDQAVVVVAHLRGPGGEGGTRAVDRVAPACRRSSAAAARGTARVPPRFSPPGARERRGPPSQLPIPPAQPLPCLPSPCPPHLRIVLGAHPRHNLLEAPLRLLPRHAAQRVEKGTLLLGRPPHVVALAAVCSSTARRPANGVGQPGEGGAKRRRRGCVLGVAGWSGASPPTGRQPCHVRRKQGGTLLPLQVDSPAAPPPSAPPPSSPAAASPASPAASPPASPLLVGSCRQPSQAAAVGSI